MKNYTLAKLFNNSVRSILNWRTENRPIIKLIESVFEDEDIVEFLKTGKIEKLKTSDAHLNNKQEEDIIYYFRSLKDEQKEIAFFKVMYELSKIKEENK